MTNTNVRVLLASDNALWRRGWEGLEDLLPGLTFCGMAATTPIARRMLDDSQPDLLVLDLTLPGGDPLELCRECKRQKAGPRILVFASPEDGASAELAAAAIKAGVHGYLDRGHSVEEIAEAVCLVLGGEVYLPHDLTQKIFRLLQSDTLEKGKGRAVEGFSAAEEAVWQLLTKGRSTLQIATGMHRSVKTVETHYGRMRRKLGVKTLGQLRLLARQARGRL